MLELAEVRRTAAAEQIGKNFNGRNGWSKLQSFRAWKNGGLEEARERKSSE